MEDKELKDELLAKANSSRVRAFLKIAFSPIATMIEEEEEEVRSIISHIQQLKAEAYEKVRTITDKSIEREEEIMDRLDGTRRKALIKEVGEMSYVEQCDLLSLIECRLVKTCELGLDA